MNQFLLLKFLHTFQLCLRHFAFISLLDIGTRLYLFSVQSQLIIDMKYANFTDTEFYMEASSFFSEKLTPPPLPCNAVPDQ